ncbi:M24 family metallopeptidase [Sporosarcina ureilytica]|uniref:Peptidase M24 family protein n=1 Tax=Sporosarcina ureilytica TaxID=298596 RepID=A0A1D8JIP6_9BACL|nr:Xaa-Pro peptidase family protein [Sporosarcina ureilytica]AOV08577.1 peptidase M24 family protein [Sporosarcina ureilytica]
MSTIYEQRRNALTQYLVEQKIEVAMITDPANVFYYSGFNSDPHERFMSLMIDTRAEKTILFVPALDQSAAEAVTDVANIISISDEQIPFEVVSNALSNDAKLFGVEKKSLSLFRYDSLLAYFQKAEVVDIQPFTDKLRMRKSREEIELMQNAVNIIENVLAEGIKKVKVGMTELELTAVFETLMREFGADGPSFSTIVLSGEKAALPHGTPGDRKFQDGDFLLIDFGVVKDGYCSDTTRTFVIGEPTEKQREIYDIVLRSNQAGIDAVKAGVPLNTFDIAARDVIANEGYNEYFNNRVGHGLGIEVHEEPSVHGNNEDIANEGLVFTIEPGIYIPEYGGVRIEDTVYINENGEAEVLTSFPRELQTL